jgi:hypothetical protein
MRFLPYFRRPIQPMSAPDIPLRFIARDLPPPPSFGFLPPRRAIVSHLPFG